MTCPKHPVWRLREGGACPDCLQAQLAALRQGNGGSSTPKTQSMVYRLIDATLATMPNRAWQRHIIKIVRDYGLNAAVREARIYQQ